MATTACFMIVSRNDIPIYEAEVGTAPKKEDAAHQHQFILHAALDIVQDLAWTTSAMFLKSIDRFNDLVVSVYVTAGHILHMLQEVLFSRELFNVGMFTEKMLGLLEFLRYDWILCLFVSLYLVILGTARLWVFVTLALKIYGAAWEIVLKFFLWKFTDVLLQNLQILLNPLYLPGSRITSSHFDTKVRALARKYL
nr:trafficking protein particle complex subunit 2 [Nicotiana tomentosiformis]